MQEGVFDQVAQLVQVFVIGLWRGSVLSGRDHHVHALTASLLDDRLAIIAFISDQMFCREAFDQAASLRTIRHGTLCNTDSERQTMRIPGQMYLGVEPPFVRLISWLPPLAPAARGCTLQWLASIISHS